MKAGALIRTTGVGAYRQGHGEALLGGLSSAFGHELDGGLEDVGDRAGVRATGGEA